MSTIEGGAFICYAHDFTTESVQEWDEHCFKKGHTLQVSQICPDCGDTNINSEYPYPKKYVEKSHANAGPAIVLDCPNCKSEVEQL